MSYESVQWNSSFETGLMLIDQEHQTLLEQLNLLIGLLANNAAADQWLPELDRLIDQVVNHFKDEEQVMDNIGYPGYHAHRQQHQQLLREVGEFRARLVPEAATSETLATARFLKFWVLKHMVQEDSKIRQHIYHGLLPG